MATPTDKTKTLRPAAKLPEPAKAARPPARPPESKAARPAAKLPEPAKAARPPAKPPESKAARPAAKLPPPARADRPPAKPPASAKGDKSPSRKPVQEESHTDPDLDTDYDPVAAANALEKGRSALPERRDSLEDLRFREELTPMDLPVHKPSKDYTEAVAGWGAGVVTDKNVNLTDLSVADEVRLLAENNIFLSTRAGETGLGLGAMAAYVVGNTLAPSDRLAVRLKKVALRTPNVDRTDNSSISYAEFESNIQRQSITKSDLNLGMPGVFQVNATYSNSSAISIHTRDVKIHFQASQIIPKAKVVIERPDIELDEKFVRLIADVRGVEPRMAPAEVKRRAKELLGHLEIYGHFVPTTLVLGGRITLHTSTQLSDRSQFEAAKQELTAAAKGELKAKNVQGSVGGGNLSSQQSQTTSVVQDKSLQMELTGGNPTLGSSQAESLGTQWMGSLAPYIVWRVIGFTDKSLVPIIDLLEPELKNKCYDLLRQYFLIQLDQRKSDIVGGQHGEPFNWDISSVKRITEIVVNYQYDVNGLSWSYESYGEGGKTTAGETGRYGKFQGNRQTGPAGQEGPRILLKDDEELIAIEAGIDLQSAGIIKQIAFTTNRKRWPSDTGYYGTNRVDYYKTIQVPRVRGMFGSAANLIHSIGLNYLALADDTMSRAYLLAMEPNLFPDRDYGIVK